MVSAKKRTSKVLRKTNETEISLSITIDGQGKTNIKTGVPFMDHMLTLFAVHGFFDLTVKAKGDTEVDDHHTVEDIGICLGQAIKSALKDFKSIKRYGFTAVPMDETLVRITTDLSNRPFLHYGVSIHDQKVGTFDTALNEEFLKALTQHAGMALHVELVHGENAHHNIEAIFKALGKALDMAATAEPRSQGSMSSKGTVTVQFF